MRTNYTDYMYFGKYPYKIIFHDRKRDADTIRIINNLKDLDLKLNKKEVRYTYKVRLFAYTTDYTVYNTILSAYSPILKICYQPINNYHLKLMIENHGSIIFREKTFYDKFNFMLAFKTSKDGDQKNQVLDFLNISSFINGQDYSLTPASRSCVVYTSSIELIDLLLLTYSELLLSLKQVVTFDNISNNEPIVLWKDM